ncbi:hypothetical protein IV54_GL001715 [Levilactobacillus paucivorans]|uniref:DUF5776 domain-containing protein n=1 Tax=Levilactobacillus paucivorans TaxID=616990 RepID=A0A0R2LRG1_9LACO|nr:DUF5776 domain-containing protein [Levilactobacillus paucivorans]KRO04193.1 hypothetical protein IV54_GL001715 [Levilactobacillus paucivorans]
MKAWLKFRALFLSLGIILGIFSLFLIATPLPVKAATDPDYAGVMTRQNASGIPVSWTLTDGILTLNSGFLGDYDNNSVATSTSGQLIKNLKNSTMTGGTSLPVDEDGHPVTSLVGTDFTDMIDAITKIELAGPIHLGFKGNSDGNYASYLFAGLPNVKTYSGLDNLDLSAVDGTTGLQYMFANNPSLVTFTAPKFNVTADHTINDMFAGDSSLIYVDLSQMATQNITTCMGLFQENTALETANLANFGVSPTIAAATSGMFAGTDKLRHLTLSPQIHFGTSLLTRPDLTPDFLPQTDFTGTWQAVGSGKVDFINNDPTQGYLNYNPQGEKDITTDDLLSRYPASGSDITTNVTYVWQPVTPIIAPVSPGTSIPEADPDQGVDLAPYDVVATHKIGLYRTSNFTAASRLHWFAKKPQMKRPTFTIIGTATSVNGNPRYQVRDTNRGSNTYGKTGYITAKPTFVTPKFIQKTPDHITVIAIKRINGYNNAQLAKKQIHYTQGTVLTVKQVITTGHVTRFRLTNGHYITANRRLVTTSQVKMPTKVRNTATINRYTNANLTTRNHHYSRKAPHVFTVLGWDYSQGSSAKVGGTLRYRVAGGYITSNPKLVTTLK